MQNFEKRFVEEIERLKKIETQAQIATKLSIAPQSLSQILKGKRSPTVTQISKLFSVYGIEPNSILIDTSAQDRNKEELADVSGYKDRRSMPRVNDPPEEYLTAIKYLRETVETQKKLIDLYENQINELKRAQKHPGNVAEPVKAEE